MKHSNLSNFFFFLQGISDFRTVKTFEPKHFFEYFRDCYRLDYSEFNVYNMLSVKYKYKWFSDSEEYLLSGKFTYAPYFNKKSDHLKKEVALYSLDKQLFYGVFFVLGQNTNPKSKDRRFCAPLFLFPAVLREEDGDTFLEINKEEGMVNPQVLNKLDLKPGQVKETFVQSCLNYGMDNHTHGFGLRKLMDETFTNINTDELRMYPTVWTEAKLKRYFVDTSLETDTYIIVPAAGSILADTANASQKVIVDLTAIAEQNKLNASLQKLLNGKTTSRAYNDSLLKSRVNESQYQAIINANRYTNSVIVGPPGTGKSYTLSIIVADAVLQNKSVLVVSKTKAAVEVLRTILKDQFQLEDYSIHTSGFGYRRSLGSKINRRLSGIVAPKRKAVSASHINNLYNKLQIAERRFENGVQKEIERSSLDFLSNKTFSEKFRWFYLNYLSDLGESIWLTFFEIETYTQQLNKELKGFVRSSVEKQVHQNTNRYRSTLSAYEEAFSSPSFSEYKKKLERIDQDTILKIFPVWLAHLSELNAVLPMKAELFDLVIIDEATQCDIASALPAIYRAKQVVVAGDPNQLKHYSFVSQKQQRYLREKYQLPDEKFFDYRNRSILDLFVSQVQYQDQVSFLREHFRSTPSLIEFSNRQFYDGQLEVIKSTPEHTHSSQIELIHLDGTRNKKGVNLIEAEAVLTKIDDIISSYEQLSQVPSIGVVSLFSNQATHINKLIKKVYDLRTIKKYNLLCGTPYQFQGNEREIILLSTVICPETHHAALIHSNRPEVLNVAITRAKSKQYVFTSVRTKHLKPGTLLRSYFEFIKEYKYSEITQVAHDQFQEEVVHFLQKNHYDTILCGYPVAGSVLDILIVTNNQKYCIDLIGYPGDFVEAFTIERYKTLSRTGIICCPLHYGFWTKNSDRAQKLLLSFLKK